MKKIYAASMAALLCTLGHAEGTTVKLDYQNFNFKNSDIEDQDITYGVALDYKTNSNLYQLYYEKTRTDTCQPPLPEDLNVDRVYFKYSHAFECKHGVSVNYATIDDNLAKETDGGISMA